MKKAGNKKAPTITFENKVAPGPRDQLTPNLVKIKNKAETSSGNEMKKPTNPRNRPGINSKNKRNNGNKQIKIPLTIIPETTLPQIEQNVADKNKENEEKEGVPLEKFGNNIRILVQKNETNWAECFMCCASQDTIFIPNLNDENNLTNHVTCSKCQFDTLKFGVMYNPFPICNPGSKELYICLNCKTIYSPLQYELAIVSMSNQ